jgi:hypothetical protein
MPVSERYHSPVQRQVEAYQDSDSWLADHEAVQECWKWEDMISVGLKCGELLEKVTHTWRERVFRGTESAEDGGNELYRSLYECWLSVTENILRRIRQQVEPDFIVEGAEELRIMSARFQQALKEWQPPQLSISVGLREITLSAEAATRLQEILDAEKSDPSPMPTGLRMTEISPEEFLARTRRS